MRINIYLYTLLAPDSIIVHGSRINPHVNGEYIKLLNSSGGERKRNDRLIYRHECNPLYIFFVKHPVIPNDNGKQIYKI